MNLEIRIKKDVQTNDDNTIIIVKSEQNDFTYRTYRNCKKLLQIKTENGDNWITFVCDSVLHQFKITDFNLISFFDVNGIERFSKNQISEIIKMLNAFKFKEEK